MSLTKWTGHKCVLTSIIDAWLIAKLNIKVNAFFAVLPCDWTFYLFENTTVNIILKTFE